MKFLCTHCKAEISSEIGKLLHCNRKTHQLAAMSDNEREWKHRCFPAGFDAETGRVCNKCHSKRRSRKSCKKAHSEEELAEWKERWHYREMKQQKERSSAMNLPSHFMAQNDGRLIESNRLNSACISVSTDLRRVMPETNRTTEWTFRIFTELQLLGVFLLDGIDREHFTFVPETTGQDTCGIKPLSPPCYEISGPNVHRSTNGDVPCYVCTVNFFVPSRGTFHQFVSFNFDGQPLVTKIEAVVVSRQIFVEFSKAKENVASFLERQQPGRSVHIVPFNNRSHYLKPQNNESLISSYPLPLNSNFITPDVVKQNVDKSSYKTRQHQLLYIEEIAQQALLSRFSMTSLLSVTNVIEKNSDSLRVRQQFREGHLFAFVDLLPWVIKGDVDAGKLMLYNCDTVLISPTRADSEQKVYEAVIELKKRSGVWIQFSETCIQDMNLKPNQTFEAEVKFQLKRLPFCEMHMAVDKLPTTALAFPDIGIVPYEPWEESRNCQYVNPYLTLEQKKAILTIAAPLSITLPPILIGGAFGTGKSFTLFEAAKLLLKNKSNRVLLCTNSNSAADVYIMKYFHPYITEECRELKILRLYYNTKHGITHVPPAVRKYCLMESTKNGRKIKAPVLADIRKYRIIVTNLRTSRNLFESGIQKGFFTHILIDEASQALECDVLMPLFFATEKTRIVLAGDTKQVVPKVCSSFVKSCKFGESFLERLWNLYPSNFPCKFLLTQNFSSHHAIVQFASSQFYNNEVSTTALEPKHEFLYPLAYFPVREDEQQNRETAGFYNKAEIDVTVNIIQVLKETWPVSWGPQDDTSIAVLTPYTDQVYRINGELRSKGIENVFVGKLSETHGKLFRVVLLSVVRNVKTLPFSQSLALPEYELDYVFLSDKRLVCTVFAKARSLICVVGNQETLLHTGACSDLWRKFFSLCTRNSSVSPKNFSCSVKYLKKHMKKEIVPRKLTKKESLQKVRVEHRSTQTSVVGNSDVIASATSGPDLEIPCSQIPVEIVSSPQLLDPDIPRVSSETSTPDISVSNQILTKSDSDVLYSKDELSAFDDTPVSEISTSKIPVTDDLFDMECKTPGSVFTIQAFLNVLFLVMIGLLLFLELLSTVPQK